MSDLFIEQTDSGLTWEALPVSLAYPQLIKTGIHKMAEEATAKGGIPGIVATFDHDMRMRFGSMGYIYDEMETLIKKYVTAFHVPDVRSRYQVMWQDAWTLRSPEEAKRVAESGVRVSAYEDRVSALTMTIVDLRTRHMQFVQMGYETESDGDKEVISRWMPRWSRSTDIQPIDSGTHAGVVSEMLLKSFELRERIHAEIKKGDAKVRESLEQDGMDPDFEDLTPEEFIGMVHDVISMQMMQQIVEQVKESVRKISGDPTDTFPWTLANSPHLEDARVRAEAFDTGKGNA